MSNKFVHFNGENYEEVLTIVSGYIRCKKHEIELHVFNPLKGDIAIRRNCHIINSNNEIKIIYD